MSRATARKTASVSSSTEGTAASAARRRPPWQAYIDAALGFRNHWYPVFFGSELKEADVSPGLGEGAVTELKTVEVLGERILFRRVNGKICAIKDQCLHKGSPFSVKPECFTRETITCWYHGFTYDLRDGRLKTILTDPKSPLIGKVAIKSYPVEERQGVVFVFVGDMDPPPPLSDDVQPGFLDDSLSVYPAGRTVVAKGNWRMAAENGFDPAHTYIHRNSPLVRAFRLPTVFGDTGLSDSHGMKVIDGPGPKGVMLIRGVGNPVWEAEIDGVKLRARYLPGEPDVNNEMVPEVSIWMPGGLKVDPFPAPGILMFEWYVPVDEDRYRYIMTWARYTKSDEERERFFDECTTLWKPLVPTTFTNEDEQARESIHEFYASEGGWYKERLFGPDVVITRWRELASRTNRGIQHRG